MRDHNNVLVDSATLTLPAGGESEVELAVTLPSARGVYTWSVAAVNAAEGSEDDRKTFTVYAVDLYLKVRSALYYTGFESMPPDWSNIGGNWSIVGGDVEGNALQGIATSEASLYYWTGRISGFGSLKAIVQVKALPGAPAGLERLGLAPLVDSTRFYTVSLDFTGKDRAFEILYYDGEWSTVTSAPFKPSTRT